MYVLRFCGQSNVHSSLKIQTLGVENPKGPMKLPKNGFSMSYTKKIDNSSTPLAQNCTPTSRETPKRIGLIPNVRPKKKQHTRPRRKARSPSWGASAEQVYEGISRRRVRFFGGSRSLSRSLTILTLSPGKRLFFYSLCRDGHTGPRALCFVPAGPARSELTQWDFAWYWLGRASAQFDFFGIFRRMRIRKVRACLSLSLSLVDKYFGWVRGCAPCACACVWFSHIDSRPRLTLVCGVFSKAHRRENVIENK